MTTPTVAMLGLPEGLYTLSQSMNEGAALSQILKELGACAAQWTLSDDSLLVLKDTLVRNGPGDSLQITSFKEGDASTEWICEHRKPLIVPNLNYASSESDLALQNRGFESYMGVPVSSEGKVEGALYILNRTSRDYDQGEVKVLETLASLASVAVSWQKLNSRLEESHRTMVRFALVDPLTNLATKRQFDYMLEREWKRMEEEMTPLALLQIEVANFTVEENRIGSQESREMFYKVSKVLDNALYRPSDLVARIEENRFVVLLPNTSASGARSISGRLLAEIESLDLNHPQQEDSQVRLNIGAATYHPLKLQGFVGSAEELLEKSEQALKEANEKDQGLVIAQ